MSPKNKIIYVTEEQDNLVNHVVIDIVGPKKLDDLLEQGWYISKSEKVKVHHPVAGKRITVRRVELTNDRGVTVSDAQGVPEQPASREVGSVVAQGFNMLAKALERNHGPPGTNANGYLGQSIAGQIPGVGLVTSLAPNGAFGLGVDAAKGGQSEEKNPFPEGSLPFAEWLKGFIGANGRPDPETLVGMEEGRRAAQGPENAEVTTRFAVNTRGYVGFLIGFTRAGGKIAGNGNV